MKIRFIEKSKKTKAKKAHNDTVNEETHLDSNEKELQTHSLNNQVEHALSYCQKIDLETSLVFYKKPQLKVQPIWKSYQNKFSTEINVGKSYSKDTSEKHGKSDEELMEGFRLVTKEKEYQSSDYTVEVLRKMNTVAFLEGLELDVGEVKFKFGKSQIFIKTDGTFLLYSNNPAVATLLSYFTLSQLINRTKSSYPVLLEYAPKNLPTIQFKEENLNQTWFIEQCIDSYFENYSYFCPVLNEPKFRLQRPKLLVKIVVTIGYKHLPNIEPSQKMLQLMDEDILSEYRSRMNQPTLDHISALTLMFQYQVCIGEANAISIYLSKANHLCYLLGLHQPFPKSRNFSNEILRYRSNQWWGCAINDRLYSLLLDKPFTFKTTAFELPYPMPVIPTNLAQYANPIDCAKIRYCASAVYWKGKTIYSDLLVYFVDYKQLNQKVTVTVNFQLASKLLSEIDRFNDLHLINMSRVWINQPPYARNICDFFLSYHYLFYHSYVLEVIKIYINNPFTTDLYLFKYRYYSSATKCIEIAEKLGVLYHRQGVVYRFCCLFNATMVFAKLLSNSQDEPLLSDPVFLRAHPILSISQSVESKSIPLMMVDKGLTMLSDSLPYHPVVKPFIQIILEIVTNSYI